MAGAGLVASDLFLESSSTKPSIVATYNYTDEFNELLYQVVRFEPKDFRQRRPTKGTGWTWKLGDVRRVLYRLPHLRSATVYIVEGEKDVDRLAALKFPATTNAGGAGKMAARVYAAADGRQRRERGDHPRPRYGRPWPRRGRGAPVSCRGAEGQDCRPAGPAREGRRLRLARRWPHPRRARGARHGHGDLSAETSTAVPTETHDRLDEVFA